MAAEHVTRLIRRFHFRDLAKKLLRWRKVEIKHSFIHTYILMLQHFGLWFQIKFMLVRITSPPFPQDYFLRCSESYWKSQSWRPENYAHTEEHVWCIYYTSEWNTTFVMKHVIAKIVSKMYRNFSHLYNVDFIARMQSYIFPSKTCAFSWNKWALQYKITLVVECERMIVICEILEIN